MLPSDDNDTEQPWLVLLPIELLAPDDGATNFCCKVHVVPERVQIQQAPILLLSLEPPIANVLPSDEYDTERPCCEEPIELLSPDDGASNFL